MTADPDDHDHAEGHETPATGRTTAPQSAYAIREVTIGFAVMLFGLVLAFGIPLAATL
jgi:hypothetical protein